MIIDEVVSFLKDIPPFQFLEEEELKGIAANLTLEFYPKGTLILKQGSPNTEGLRIIKKGAVKVFITNPSGEELTVDYRGEGDNFGLWSLVSNEGQKTNVLATEDTLCYLLPKEKVLQLLDSNAIFTEYFLKSHLSRYLDKTFKEIQKKSLSATSPDRALFTTKIEDIASKTVITANQYVSIREAAQIMVNHRISSLVIVDDNNLPVGIITDRDLREKVVAKARDVNEPVSNIMSLPLIRVDANNYCYEAILKMIRHRIHHLLVIKDGELKGILTNHDLLLLQGTSPLSLAQEIQGQQTIDGLASLSKKIQRLVGLLLKQGARASNIMRIISEINDSLVKRVLEIAEKRFGKPPLPYCWIAYGSEGRMEQTFKTDQDNAIIYADVTSSAKQVEATQYFSEFTLFVKDSLVKCGFPPCPANYMASNPQWCQPLSTWKKYFSNWIHTPLPESILKSLIFFDFRPIHGDYDLAESLRNHLTKSLKGQNIFLALMASAIVKNTPPLGIFKTFIIEKSGEHKDQLNLKVRGLGPLVDAVRLLALESGVTETSTLERIRALKARNPVISEMSEELEYAFEFIFLLRIHHQMEQIEQGLSPDNYINPAKLNNLEKKSLKESFRIISKLQNLIIEQYRAGMVAG